MVNDSAVCACWRSTGPRPVVGGIPLKTPARCSTDSGRGSDDSPTWVTGSSPSVEALGAVTIAPKRDCGEEPTRGAALYQRAGKHISPAARGTQALDRVKQAPPELGLEFWWTASGAGHRRRLLLVHSLMWTYARLMWPAPFQIAYVELSENIRSRHC